MSGVLERVKGWLFAEDDGDEAPPPTPAAGAARPRLLLQRGQDELFVRWPRSLDEAQVCADYLKARRPVIVNLRMLDDGQARRVLDFFSGVIYAIDGQLEQAGDGIYVLAPSNTLITVDDAEQPLPLVEDTWTEPS